MRRRRAQQAPAIIKRRFLPAGWPALGVHNHGHVTGTGPSRYSLILLGDDMLLFEREEYDPERGTWQRLAPGDPGRSNR
jgi:hypothetical protein